MQNSPKLGVSSPVSIDLSCFAIDQEKETLNLIHRLKFEH